MPANLTRTWPEIIAHADMDAFYAAVEQRDDPGLRGRPVLVGSRSGRGVVLTASYEARPFGVGSAMPMVRALKLCPQAVVVAPRFDRYEAASRQLMAVLDDFSPRVEALSLDEAFVDMSGAEHLFGPPDVMARRIRDAVRQATDLPASVGISGTKYVAKVASGQAKPAGVAVVPPEAAAAWLAPMPVAVLWGAGPVTQKRLQAAGYRRVGDIARADPQDLERRLGAAGAHFRALALGQDPRRVARRRAARSMGADRTLKQDVNDRDAIARHLTRAADRIGRRLRRKGYLAYGVRVRLKTSDFRLLSRQRHVLPTDAGGDLLAAALQLLDAFPAAGPYRLVGMAAFDLEGAAQPSQLELFSGGERRRRLESTLDAVSERFGDGAVRRARDMVGSVVVGSSPTLDFMDHGGEDAEDARDGVWSEFEDEWIDEAPDD
ncbi:MAG: DNA polymerase IV [Pseudomonadales bacterium]